jgi:hypothetical protein
MSTKLEYELFDTCTFAKSKQCLKNRKNSKYGAEHKFGLFIMSEAAEIPIVFNRTKLYMAWNILTEEY